jgi:hypothetical protein
MGLVVCKLLLTRDKGPTGCRFNPRDKGIAMLNRRGLQSSGGVVEIRSSGSFNSDSAAVLSFLNPPHVSAICTDIQSGGNIYYVCTDGLIAQG